MRLQHSGGAALYRDVLQAAIWIDSCSVFVRKAAFLLRLAHCAATIGTASPTIRVRGGWDNEGVDE